MEKKFDWFGLAPYGAGSPPALVMAINLYKSVMASIAPGLWPFGMLVAAVGVIGMMAVEVGTYKMLARAFADKEWKAAGFAFIGALLVTGMLVFSVYTGAETRSLLSSTAVMLVGYLALMVREYLETTKVNRNAVLDVEIERQRAEAERLKAEAEVERQRTAQARANARAVKAGQGGQASAVRRTAGQSSGQLDEEKVLATVAYLKTQADPKTVSVRDLEAAGLGYKKTVAAAYKSEALKRMGE